MLKWTAIKEEYDLPYAKYEGEQAKFVAVTEAGEYQIEHWSDGEYYAFCPNTTDSPKSSFDGKHFLSQLDAEKYCQTHWEKYLNEKR